MSSLFQWRQEHAVGVERIDSQHRQLFQLAGELHSALLAGEGKPRLQEMLTRLNRYVALHLADEEGLMLSIGYPGYPEHVRHHQELRRSIADFEGRRGSGETAITIRLMEFLAGWLAGHTTTEDRLIGDYMRHGGVS